jgi:putative sporulation protein YtaF
MLLSIFLLGVTLSMDSIFVGITYGIKGTKVPFLSLIVILTFSTLYAGISILFGCGLKALLNASVINIIGSLILVALGTKMISNSLKKEKQRESKRSTGLTKIIDMSAQVFQNPEASDIDNSGVIDLKEAFFLTLALSADSLVAGIAGGMFSFSVWMFPVIIGLFQTVFLCLGVFIGNLFKEKAKLHNKYVSILAGIALVVFSLLKML